MTTWSRRPPIWFRTQENQIINLKDCDIFWIEDLHNINIDEVKVFCRLNEIDWTIAVFTMIADAKDYIDEIYLKLLYEQELENENTYI